MRGTRPVYRRKLSNVRAWRNFSIQHVAFALHRLTGWLLLGWVCVHLVVPAATDGPAAVWQPTSPAVIVGLLAVLLFHAFNGVRLLTAEFLGVGAGEARRVFEATLVASALAVVALGGLL